MEASHTNSNCSQTHRNTGHCTCLFNYILATSKTSSELKRWLSLYAMGVNNSLSLQECWHRLPSSLVSQGRSSKVWPARLLLPAFLLFLSLPPSLFYFTHFQRDGLQTEMASQAKLSQQHLLGKPSKPIPSGVVVWAPANASTDMESTTTEGAPVAEGLLEEANAIGNSGKNDRDRNTLHTGNSWRVHSSRRSIPGKIWVSTNQIRAISLRAHVYRELLARALQASRGI